MNIKYKVEFFTDWHCGSGMAAGADVDALVVKDSQGLPFLPGKTVKGLLREAMEDIVGFRFKADPARYNDLIKEIKDTFGYFNGNSYSGDNKNKPEMTKGGAFFTNAELPADERKTIVAERLQPYLFRTLSSTAVDDRGIAVDHSLRRIEVAVPCTLEGEILDLPECRDFLELIKDGMRYVKRLGQNRNRGLGRCRFIIKDSGNNKSPKAK